MFSASDYCWLLGDLLFKIIKSSKYPSVLCELVNGLCDCALLIVTSKLHTRWSSIEEDVILIR